MKNSPKILCVEDHPDTCELISTILNEFEVVSANSYTDAIDKIDSDLFVLHIFDYHLPDGTGTQLCEEVRSRGVKTPVIFITGSSQLTRKDVQKVGGQELIRKGEPEFPDQLRETVAAICGL